MVNPISLSISPFLLIDANTNQNKYKVQKCNKFAFMMNVHRLLGVKPIEIITKNEWFAFLLFNILDHICTTCLFLQIFWKKNSTSNSFQIVKGIRIWLQEAFFRIEISLLFQMLFLWLNKNSPWMNSSLSFQEGFWKRYQVKLFQLKFLILTWYFKIE
jgi:hypothetical protein